MKQVARAVLALPGRLALVAIFVLGCTDTTLIPRTQVLVQIDASPAVRARTDVLRVSFASGKGEPSGFEEAGQERFTIDKTFSWPASLALLPRGGDAERGFRIFVEALDSEGAFVTARVISYFLDEQTLLLEIVLEDGCVEYLSCGEEETCLARGGLPSCASAKLDPRDLKSISKAPGRERPDASSGAQDAGQDASEVDASEVDASEVDASEVDASELDASEVEAGNCRAEDCFNGSDDDCDSLPDCADPDCNAGAMCADDASELAVKVPVGTSCPAGYTRAPKQLHKDLGSGPCTGCTCGAAGPTTCRGTVTAYSAPSGCSGTLVPLSSAAVTSGVACPASGATPIIDGSMDALGLSVLTATAGNCPASGAATPGPTFWGNDSTLCYLERKGGGCGPGNVCIPRHDIRALCTETTSTSCPTGDVREIWYTGVSDNRTCGTCSCAAVGASCAGVSLNYGNDWTCGTRSVLAGQVACSQAYSPPAALVGTPTRASCMPNAPISGAATPTGATTLCCRQ